MKKEQEQLEVTTVTDLERYSEGFRVELPSFSDNNPLVVMLRRPGVVELARNGTIPNQLLGIAMELFTGDKKMSEKTDHTAHGKMKEMSQFAEVLKIIAKESLVSPTYNDFVNAGVELTDEQLLAIYNFTQTGIENMRSFRPKQKN